MRMPPSQLLPITDQHSLCELAPVVALGCRNDTRLRTDAKRGVRMRHVTECSTSPLIGNW